MAVSTPIQDFNRWLRHSKPGEKTTYHTGNLCADRVRAISLPGVGLWRSPGTEQVHMVGMAAWAAYLAGQVSLVQKRVGPAHYIYFAIRRKQR